MANLQSEEKKKGTLKKNRPAGLDRGTHLTLRWGKGQGGRAAGGKKGTLKKKNLREIGTPRHKNGMPFFVEGGEKPREGGNIK